MERGTLLQHLLGSRNEPATGPDRPMLYSVDRFSVFDGSIHLAGWTFAPGAAIRSVELRFPSGAKAPLASYGLPSPDVAAAHGPGAEHVRFDEIIRTGESLADIPSAWLAVTIEGRGAQDIRDFGMPGPEDHGVQIQDDFAVHVRSRPAGRLLEIGSRARSGVTRRDLAPPGWSYTGLDVMAGENVDVVGDAHRLSRLFPAGSFDAVAAFSVIEHLLMPWKFAVELNKVLSRGAIGLVTTHQCWPMHDVPWDHWRFSDTAWAALFNPATGFEILRTALGSPAFVVPLRCNPFTNFGGPPASFLASSVLFRKTGETTLDWPVEIEEIAETGYAVGSS